jgi:metal-responsive CopG/Arc/MetJ family transcriptional regulator
MKKKVTITLSAELLAKIDRHIHGRCSRSAFVECVLWKYFKARAREAVNTRDLELINAHSEYLAQETRDLDQFQAPIEWGNDPQ